MFARLRSIRPPKSVRLFAYALVFALAAGIRARAATPAFNMPANVPNQWGMMFTLDLGWLIDRLKPPGMPRKITESAWRTVYFAGAADGANLGYATGQLHGLVCGTIGTAVLIRVLTRTTKRP